MHEKNICLQTNHGVKINVPSKDVVFRVPEMGLHKTILQQKARACFLYPAIRRGQQHNEDNTNSIRVELITSKLVFGY